MAKKKKKQADAQPEEPQVAPAEKPKSKGRILKRLHWLLPLLFVAVAALVWAAPIVVSQTPLHGYVLSAVCSDLEGEVAADSLSLDWFSPIVIRNVTWHGPDGELLLRADSISSDRSLLDLLADRRNRGTFRVVAADMRIEIRPDGSNLEDALQAILNRQDNAPGTTELGLVVTDGRIELIDTVTGERREVTDLGLHFERTTEPAPALAFELTGDLHEGDHVGKADIRIELAELELTTADQQPARAILPRNVVCKLDQLPLQPIGMLLRRFQPDLALDGRVTCDVQTTRDSENSAAFVTAGEVSCEGLSLANAEWLGEDRFQLDRIAAGGQFQFDGRYLTLSDVNVDSSVAKMNIAGTTDVSAWGEDDRLSRLTAMLDSGNLKSQGRVDLAALAALLPDTLRVREGTELTAGALDWEFAGEGPPGSRQWKGRFAAAGLEAVESGRRISWQNPIQFSFDGHQADGETVIDQFTCRSDFLQASAQGTFSDAKLQARGDLGRLATELARFFDLGELQLAGRLNADFNCRRNSDDQVDVQGTLLVQKFLWSTPGRRPWKEDELELTLTTRALSDGQSLGPIEAGTVSLISGRDRLQAKLLEAWNWRDRESTLPVDVNLQGDAATWSARLQPWLRADGWTLAGVVKLHTLARVSQSKAEIEAAEIGFDQFVAQGPGIRIQEPQVRIETSATWDRVERRLTSKQTTLACRAAALRAVDLDARLPADAPPLVSGKVAVRGDLDRLGGWIDRGGIEPSRRMTGNVVCKLEFSRSAETTTGTAQIEAKDIAFWRRELSPGARNPAAQWQQSFAEPQLTAAIEAHLDRTQDQLTLNRLDVDSRLMKLASRGRVEQMSNQRVVDLAGNVEYDLENITLVLRELFGDGITITGHEQRQFAIRGPLSRSMQYTSDPAAPAPAAEPWTGQIGFGWASADVSGLPVGPGSLELVLSDGLGRFQPLDLAVGDGRLRAQPLLNLSGGPMTLAFQQGATLENVQLSEQVCESWLKYVAPVVAKTTRADGRFSMQVGRAEFPVMQMSQGTAAGNLQIHNAQLRPGPLAQQLVWLADQVGRLVDRGSFKLTASGETQWLAINEQNVEFQMQDGRVHHRGLEFTIGKITIRTSGSVGFDESLSLMAEVPIQDEWVEKDRYLAALKGQVLQIPVRGTISQPQLDSRALGNITSRIGTSAVRGRLQDEFQKQLGRLLNRN